MTKKDNFKNNKFVKTIECSSEEYKTLKTSGATILSEKIMEQHTDSETGKLAPDRYKLTIPDDAKLTQEILKSINNQTQTIKYCSIFFVVLTLISMITTFVFTYKLSKVTDVFESAGIYDTDYDYFD